MKTFIKAEAPVETPVKSFNNPANICGSDFLTYLAVLKMTSHASDTLLYFTSVLSKKKYGKEAILKYYETKNLNFKKQLKAIRKLNDTLFVLNYLCNINATKTLKTFTVSIEHDTCRLVK